VKSPQEVDPIKSPHQSPYVVMTAHMVLGYRRVRNKRLTDLNIRRFGPGEMKRRAMTQHGNTTQFEMDTYEIRIEGHVEHRWEGWFEGLTIEQEAGGTTKLTKPLYTVYCSNFEI
jgi:hypothetical protein